jgi:hypothetical protein
MLVPSPFIGSMAPSAAHGTRLGPAYDQPQDAPALQLTAVAAAMMTGAPPAAGWRSAAPIREALRLLQRSPRLSWS